MAPETFVAAAVQASPAFLDRDGTVEKAVGLIEEAAGEGAKLVAFPETWIPGYPGWIYGEARWEEPRSKRTFARLQQNAVQVPSPATDALCRAARENGVHLVVGIHELDAAFSTGTIYNSLLFISDEGEILGVHRKLVPTHAERILWGQGDGSTLHVFDTPLGRLGGLVCWEHWMPLTRFAMHAKGEQIHVAAWPDVPELHQLASRHYAFEGRCYVLCVGSYLRRQDLPADFELADAMADGGDFGGPDELQPGGTGIIAPDGSWIAEPVVSREAIVYGEIDLGRIAEEQQALDSAGHYNRPDVFSLTVDERPRRQVEWLRDDGAPGTIVDAARDQAEALR
ncbi:MAG TPA: carbon-nitrogen hydrolase family protein [Gaiellaceae bacterium]|jgi:predicted amidohydrolase